MQIQVSSTEIINSDNIARFFRDGTFLNFFTTDGKTFSIPYATIGLAQTALDALVSLLNALSADAPVLTQVFPNTFNAYGGGGDAVLCGYNLKSGCAITINGAAATNINIINAQTIWFTAPGNPAGTYDVVYTGPDAQTSTLTAAYTYP